MSLKTAVKPWVRPLPQWAAIGIAPPQQAISVSLQWAGQSVDVTENHTIASLRPLAVAIALSEAMSPDRAVLAYHDRKRGKELGLITLTRSFARTVADSAIGIFRVDAAEQRCLPWPERPWNAWLQSRAIRQNRNPHNFQMAPAAVQQLMTFYICPRPVVLVSVCDATHSNIFPMDLIGPLANGCFSLALRNTSISVPAMVQGRRFALSGIPSGLKNVAYKLGEHHRRGFADWGSLPFPVIPSDVFAIPVVASALWIRELSVLHSEEIGSHTFFACRTVSERRQSSGPQLHHTAGFHQEFRRRRSVAFSPA